MHHRPDQTGGLVLTHSDELTDDQVCWLQRVLESRPKRGTLDHFVVPDDVRVALVEKGLIRWHHGVVEITLDGIRAIARRPPPS